jgi:hypothetical protein
MHAVEREHGLGVQRVLHPQCAILITLSRRNLARTLRAESHNTYCRASGAQPFLSKVPMSSSSSSISAHSAAQGPKVRPTLRWREMDSNFQYAGAVSLGCRLFFSRPVAWTSRRDQSGVPRFRAFVLRVAETVDGHPEPRADCFARAPKSARILSPLLAI